MGPGGQSGLKWLKSLKFKMARMAKIVHGKWFKITCDIPTISTVHEKAKPFSKVHEKSKKVSFHLDPVSLKIKLIRKSANFFI